MKIHIKCLVSIEDIWLRLKITVVIKNLWFLPLLILIVSHKIATLTEGVGKIYKVIVVI